MKLFLTFAKLRNILQKLKNQCFSIVTIDDVRNAIKETLKVMKRHVDDLKNISMQEQLNYENSSSSSDSDNDRRKKPDILDEFNEIKGNYFSIAAFLVHVVSLPIHYLDLRAKK